MLGPLTFLALFTSRPHWVPCNRFHHVTQGSPWAPLQWLLLTIDRASQVDRLFIAYEWIWKGAGLVWCMALRVFVYLSNRWQLKRWTVRLIQQNSKFKKTLPSTALYYSDVLSTESSLTDSVRRGALRLITICGFLTHQYAVHSKVKKTSLTLSCFAGRFSSIRPFWAWFPSTSPLFKPWRTESSTFDRLMLCNFSLPESEWELRKRAFRIPFTSSDPF